MSGEKQPKFKTWTLMSHRVGECLTLSDLKLDISVSVGVIRVLESNTVRNITDILESMRPVIDSRFRIEFFVTQFGSHLSHEFGHRIVWTDVLELCHSQHNDTENAFHTRTNTFQFCAVSRIIFSLKSNLGTDSFHLANRKIIRFFSPKS